MTNRVHARAAALCAFVGVVAGFAAALGVFARGDGSYVPATSAVGEAYQLAVGGIYAGSSRQLVAEGVGWDVFSLAVAVPIMLTASVFVARASFRGYLVAAGMLGYFLYMHLEYAVTWAFGPMFPVFVVVTASSLVGLVSVAAVIADAGVRGRFDHRFPRHGFAALNLGMAFLLVIMWAGRIAEGLNAETAVLHGETTMTVQALDLALVIPTSVMVAVSALRRQPVGMAAAAAFGVTFVTMSAAIAAMMISASMVTGTLQLPPIVVFGVAAAAGLTILTRTYASVRPAATPGVRTHASSAAAAA